MESNTPPNIIADPRARTSQIQLDNSVMWFPSSGTHYYLPFRHVVRAYAPQDLIDQLKAPRFSVLGANGRINGGFEKNGIYHSFGGIELLLPPAVIFAEAAELTFESNYCAKVSAGNGAIRRYKNGTFTLEGAIIIITEMVGPSASKNFRIGFYGHLPSNPITPQNQIAYSSGY
ncbi:MAG: hypothetical protein KKC75_08350 [Nanoarchaeota archaeon]|nr:hypothetical protein [Nanoarchaeota archaeon]MBU1004482.1 hypothetical protein [Nanoarchaeota archaeon]